MRAHDVGVILRDRLADSKRAMVAFERAVEVDPQSHPSLTALARLYAEADEWQRFIGTNERLLDLSPHDAAERRRLMFEIAEAAETRLSDARAAFDWYRRAHNEGLGDEPMQRLEALAARQQLWEPLIEVYEGARAKATDPAAQVALSLRIARVIEKSMGDPARALGVLREALASEPDGRRLLPEIERLAAEASDWPILLDVYAQVARARPDLDERLSLLRMRADVRERRLNDPSGALDEHLRAFSLAPEDGRTRAEIARLAEVTGRWEEAIGVESQRFARAVDTSDKVAIACRAAALVEEKLRDPRRAFVAYLNAFRLSPEDEAIVGHLWRLAVLVEANRSGPAVEELPELPDDVSEELIEEIDDAAIESESVITEVRATSPEADASDTAALPTTREAADREAGDAASERSIITSTYQISSSGPQGDEIELVTPAGGASAKPVRRSVPATPPPLTETSTWAEFVRAYELLPAPDTATRHRYLRRIAEIWERGAADTSRALAALERAFHLDTEDRAVRAELERIAGEARRWDEVCAIFERAAESAPRLAASRLYHDVARFREQLGQRDQVERVYQTILVLDGEDATAQDRLEDILRSNERWADLASLLEKRIAAAESGLPEGDAGLGPRWRRTLELASLYDQRLQRPYEAIDTYERFLAEAGDDLRGSEDETLIEASVDALEALVDLYGRVGMPGKAAQALRREIDIVNDRSALRGLRMRLGELEERELAQPEAALLAYRAV
ncbi:MAG TPA: hypothetical protein VGF45_05100, partial [Polyangia bacterium]